MRKLTLVLAVLGLTCAPFMFQVSTVPAQSDTNGKVTLESKSVAIGIGVSWGDGVLEYQGRRYPFSIQGLSVVDLGVGKVSARGDVKHLTKIEDFNGTYVAAGAGAAVGGGGAAAALKNQNGVEIALTATTVGIKFSLPAGGVEMKLKQ